MPKLTFERHITRYEIEYKCLMLQEDDGTDHSNSFQAEHLLLLAKGKEYPAIVRDFYTKKGFETGIAFEDDEVAKSFFFDQSVSESKRLKFSTDPGYKRDGKQLVDVEIYIVTKDNG